MHHYLARLSYNTAGWIRPTKDAQANEEEGTYNQEHSFGHEDWLFRYEWLNDGWRYGFVQAVNRSHARLAALGEPFNLTLFTIDNEQRRRYVARIHAAECLTDQPANWALAEFMRRGWYQSMLDDIGAIGGDVVALGNSQWAKHVLNVRFRPENVRPFDPPVYAGKDDPVFFLNRYTLTDLDDVESKDLLNQTAHSGSATSPVMRPYMRRATSAVHCTPEHTYMQAELMKQLQAEYPGAQILREDEFIDVSVRTGNELMLFEIKSDLEPKSVIRQALGQILEYAYHPSRTHSPAPRLVIVGRRPLSSGDAAYLACLNSRFSIPLSYRVVPV